MQVRDLIPRTFRFLANRGVGIVEPYGSFLTPSPGSIILPVPLGFDLLKSDAKFFEFSSAEDGSPQASRP